jgi:hypothetical protein
MAARARRVATAPLGAGAERALGVLAEAEMPDEAWLAAVAAFADAHNRALAGAPRSVEIIAMLLLC